LGNSPACVSASDLTTKEVSLHRYPWMDCRHAENWNEITSEYRAIHPELVSNGDSGEADRYSELRLQNQLESLLEEAHIKLSSLVSDLLGASARRMLKALARGETNPAALKNGARPSPNNRGKGARRE